MKRYKVRMKYSSARNWLLDDSSIIEIQKLNCIYANGADAPQNNAQGCEALGDQSLNNTKGALCEASFCEFKVF